MRVQTPGGVFTERWDERGEANGEPISARALAYVIVGHMVHHLGVLRERYGVGQAVVQA